MERDTPTKTHLGKEGIAIRTVKRKSEGWGTRRCREGKQTGVMIMAGGGGKQNASEIKPAFEGLKRKIGGGGRQGKGTRPYGEKE